ncbi:MAG: hypothetical protein GY751_05975 [Bacteroidetes bacterium]|nr:hypothetical protein [Bacteroidota bacterium]
MLFIGLDGVRYDVVTEEWMPNVWDIMHEETSAYSFTGVNETITWSGPNWSTLLTGVHHQKHKVKDNFFINTNLEAWPTAFSRLESTYTNIKTASIVNWEPINEIIIRNCVDIDIVTNDNGIKNNAVDLLTNDFDLDFMFLCFNDVDEAGHFTGFSPTNSNYTNAATETDARVGQVIEAVRSRTTFADENWLIMITTDHGGEGLNHGSGGSNPNIRNVFAVFNGSAVVNTGAFENVPHHVDYATTALKHMGLSPDDLDGQVIAIE